MSTAKFNQWLNSDGTENYKCRAWVNFNGTGTVAIRASGNVSSITDNGTGNYTVNFTNAMPDVNYSWAGSVADASGSAPNISAGYSPALYSTTQLSIRTWSYVGSPFDSATLCVNIFR
jgi:hypothetical protein